MKRMLFAAAAAAGVVGLSSPAYCETLSYDFGMTVTQMTDATEPGYDAGVFQSAGLTTGSTLNVSVALNTTGDSDGTANIAISGLDVSTSNTWYSNSFSTTWSQSDGSVWQAGAGTGAGLLTLNAIEIPNGSVTQNLYLTFVKDSLGAIVLNSGWLTFAVDNSIHANLRAEYTGGATAVPELDPRMGATAMVLLLGGLAIAFSARTRRPVSTVG